MKHRKLNKKNIMKRTEQIRKEILFQLYASRPIALSPERLERDARKQGYNFTTTEIARELQFVTDEGLALEFDIKGTTIRLYRIGSEGVRQYEQNYIA